MTAMPPSGAPRAAIYARFSSDHQDELVHTRNGAPAVFIQDAASLVYARLAAARAGFDGTFLEALALDAKTAKKIPKPMISRALSQKEAAALLQRL